MSSVLTDFKAGHCARRLQFGFTALISVRDNDSVNLGVNHCSLRLR